MRKPKEIYMAKMAGIKSLFCIQNSREDAVVLIRESLEL
jgi:hypothetical protein